MPSLLKARVEDLGRLRLSAGYILEVLGDVVVAYQPCQADWCLSARVGVQRVRAVGAEQMDEAAPPLGIEHGDGRGLGELLRCEMKRCKALAVGNVGRYSST